MAGRLVVLLCLGLPGLSRAESRLRVVNGCKREPMWVAHMASNDVGPDAQNVRLEPGASFDFSTPGGLSGTRYWPKMRCDDTGNQCAIGESGGPAQVCNKVHGCAPPVDTKFEASFNVNGEDWVDISLVDGYTLPFKLEMNGGSCHSQDEDTVEFTLPASWGEFCDESTGKRYYVEFDTGRTLWDPPQIIDCSRLAFDRCPVAEDLGPTGSDIDLTVVQPEGGREAVGCYSPCSKLLFNQWGNAYANGLPASDQKNAPFCCPTPPTSPEECRTGPVGHTEFVRGVHAMCPGVYAYAYDDNMGLLKCSPETRYEVTFYCPTYESIPTPAPIHLGRTPCGTSTSTSTATSTTEPPPAPAPVPVPVPAPTGAQTPEPQPSQTLAPSVERHPSERQGGWLATLVHALKVIGLAQARHGGGTDEQYRHQVLMKFGSALSMLMAAASFLLVITRWREASRQPRRGGYEDLDHRRIREIELDA